MPEELVSRQQAATRLGVSIATIDRWLKSGTITRRPLGPHLVRISVAELDALTEPSKAAS